MRYQVCNTATNSWQNTAKSW